MHSDVVRGEGSDSPAAAAPPRKAKHSGRIPEHYYALIRPILVSIDQEEYVNLTFEVFEAMLERHGERLVGILSRSVWSCAEAFIDLIRDIRVHKLTTPETHRRLERISVLVQHNHAADAMGKKKSKGKRSYPIRGSNP